MKSVPATVLVVCGLCSMATFASVGAVPNTPETVVARFVERVASIAPNYPELAGFSKYATDRQDKLEVRFFQGVKPTQPKAAVELEPHGLILMFGVYPENLPSQPSMTSTTRHLKALHLRLYADVNYPASPKQGLREELTRQIRDHAALLEALDDQAAKQAGQH